MSRSALSIRATTKLVGLGVLAAVVALATASSAQAARPPQSVTSNAATVSAVTVNGQKLNYAIVSPGADVSVSGRYAVGDTGGAIDQIEIGWAGSSAPLGCIYDGPGSRNGRFTFDLGAPPAAGDNQVIINFAQNFSCQTDAWWSSNTGPAIGDIATTPANGGTSGSLTVSGVTIVPSSSNVQVQTGFRAVTVTGSWAFGGLQSAEDQIQVGWLGAPLSTACVKVSANSSGTFTANIGLPPNLGANYVAVGYAQNLGCKRGWFSGPNGSGAAVVALSYNTER